MYFIKYFFIFATLALFGSASFAQTQTLDLSIDYNDFKAFISKIKEKGKQNDITQATLDSQLDGLKPDLQVLKLDRKQPEFSLTFGKYLSGRLSKSRLNKGKLYYSKHWHTLNQAQKKYGVPKHIILAFWGLETNFGANTGSFNLIQSLVTLAFDKRRRSFFTKELLFALKLIDQDRIPPQAKSSWAGAMGFMQFMPSNVTNYAVDVNENGLDLWGDLPDIFASAGNFLKEIGWHKGEKWGREVILPKDFDYYLTGIKNEQSLSYWRTLGILTTKGHNLPKSSLLGAIILPAGHKGPAFLVYRNFHAILNWNRSIYYALSVGLLSDRFLSDTPLHKKPVIEPYIDRALIIRTQQKLNKMGFSVGVADGIIGPKTRSGLKDFQYVKDLPADGYLTQEMIKFILTDTDLE